MILFQVGGFYFQNIAYMLENIGFMDFILPFILIFTILFAVLDKVQVLKERKFNAIVALSIALIVVIPHVTGAYPPEADVINMINRALPGIALWIVMAVSFLILVGVFQPDLLKLISIKHSGLITAGALAVVVYIFGMSALWWEPRGILYFLSDPNTQALVVIVAIFWMVIAFITGKDETETERTTRWNWAKNLMFPPQTPPGGTPPGQQPPGV